MKLTHAIHIGITTASIAKMEAGIPVILKSNSLKDSMPVCVYVNKKGTIQVGDAAFSAHRRDIIKTQESWAKTSSNSFIEFTRTLGSNKLYYCPNAKKDFTSEELVAEVIRALLSIEKSKNINAAVITIPDGFKINQINAIRQAGKLAGLEQIEVVQKSIAAAIAFGLDSIKHQGFSLVFSFEEEFHVGLIKRNLLIDTECDNYLGSKNLDSAVVDNFILPFIKKNYTVDSFLENEEKLQALRQSLNFYAEAVIEKLFIDESYCILSDLGDILGEDDLGEEFELDILVTQDDVARAVSPVFQKAIDISLNLLKRNNLKGSSLGSLILIGGPTFSPVLRKMLEEQICRPDTSTDPMTVVSKGAALYASTVSVSEDVREQTRDKNKIQLEIANEFLTVETDQFVPIKILADKTDGEIPEKVFAEITRGDKAWSSGKVEINTIGDVVEIQLAESKTNVFEVVLFDTEGNTLESEPSSFSIIQGSKIGSGTLSYNIGTEFKDKKTDKLVFKTIKGLEKNQNLPAVGTYCGIKTPIPIHPGKKSDFIKIPIYECNSEGARIILSEHVLDVVITGENLPTLLPENSDVDLTINVDRSEKITATAYFPLIDFSIDANMRTQYSSISIKKVENLLFELTENEILSGSEFQEYFEQLSNLKERPDIDALQYINAKLKTHGIKS